MDDDTPWSPSSRRAWIEISQSRVLRSGGVSPSSRRAWIEILLPPICAGDAPVALLAEGVDRNPLSCRSHFARSEVALLAEGVDRNVADPVKVEAVKGRPPRGGRG